MGWSKRQLIEEAYAELALAGYVFNLKPDELQTALRRLDTMMGTWAAKGIQVGYAFGTTPDSSDLDQDSGLPLACVETVYLNLAVRLGAGFGKTVLASTKSAAKDGYDAMLVGQAYAQLREQQLPNTVPRGAGTKQWRGIQNPFLNTPEEAPLGIGADGGLQFNDEG